MYNLRKAEWKEVWVLYTDKNWIKFCYFKYYAMTIRFLSNNDVRTIFAEFPQIKAFRSSIE